MQHFGRCFFRAHPHIIWKTHLKQWNPVCMWGGGGGEVSHPKAKATLAGVKSGIMMDGDSKFNQDCLNCYPTEQNWHSRLSYKHQIFVTFYIPPFTAYWLPATWRHTKTIQNTNKCIRYQQKGIKLPSHPKLHFGV